MANKIQMFLVSVMADCFLEFMLTKNFILMILYFNQYHGIVHKKIQMENGTIGVKQD